MEKIYFDTIQTNFKIIPCFTLWRGGKGWYFAVDFMGYSFGCYRGSQFMDTDLFYKYLDGEKNER